MSVQVLLTVSNVLNENEEIIPLGSPLSWSIPERWGLAQVMYLLKDLSKLAISTVLVAHCYRASLEPYLRKEKSLAIKHVNEHSMTDRSGWRYITLMRIS